MLVYVKTKRKYRICVNSTGRVGSLENFSSVNKSLINEKSYDFGLIQKQIVTKNLTSITPIE